METQTEEAAPTFATWRTRLEQAQQEDHLADERAQFLRILQAVGTPMIDDSSVHFIYHGPDAQRVHLIGEFNQWDEPGIAMTSLGHSGFFYHTLEARGPVRLEYKFIVDGEFLLDPFCPLVVENGLGGENCAFEVGAIEEPPELQWLPTIPHGRIEEFSFTSMLLHNQRGVSVYMPPGYDEEETRRYPTFYVHDGSEYRRRAQLPTILDNLIHSGGITPLIAVMIDPVDRMREYWANDDYARFIEDEFLPAIDERYRTLAEREARGVMGASLGGLISCYLALSRPQLFSKVGGQSSAFFAEETRILTLVNQLSMPLSFYLDVGQYEPRFIPAHQKVVPALEAKGCACVYQELAGGHNWTSWRVHVKDMLCFLWRTTPSRPNPQESMATPPSPPQMKEKPGRLWTIGQALRRMFGAGNINDRHSRKSRKNS